MIRNSHRREQRKKSHVWGMETRNEDAILSLPVYSRWGIVRRVVLNQGLSICMLWNGGDTGRADYHSVYKRRKVIVLEERKMKYSGRLKKKDFTKIRMMKLTLRDWSSSEP